MEYDQATDERTFDDLLLHLKKADALMNLAFTATGLERLNAEHKAHDHVVKAWNTAAYLQERQ
jgi:hypothetical protein